MRRGFSLGRHKSLLISIHAPTWGATSRKVCGIWRNSISIHAPTWGATVSRHWGQVKICEISIHAPTWGATIDSDQPPAAHIISIHAPTWGATSAFALKRSFIKISIHAPTWGATWSPTPERSGKAFQSTHPRGVRHRRQNQARGFWNFNPRTHVGCDKPLQIGAVDVVISIHAPTWGATFAGQWKSEDEQFQSTHPRGVRRAAS